MAKAARPPRQDNDDQDAGDGGNGGNGGKGDAASSPPRKFFWLISKDTWAIIGAIFGIVGVGAGIYFGVRNSYLDERNQALNVENKNLSASRNRMAALELVSRYALDLPGTAKISEKGQASKSVAGRVSSAEAVSKFGPDSEFVESFDLNFPAITALVALTEALKADKETEKQKLDLVRDQVAPILFAKSQSDDPTVAAGALAVCSEVLRPEHRKEMINGRPAGSSQDELARSLNRFKDVFKDRTFLKIDFKSLKPPDFSNFLLDGASFRTVTFGGANFTDASLIGTDFRRAHFKGANLTRAKAIAKGGKEPADFQDCEFDTCNQFEGSHFEARNFSGAKFTDCNVKQAHFNNTTMKIISKGLRDEKGNSLKLGAVFDDVVFSDAKWDEAVLEICSFKNCTLKNATFAGAQLKETNFEGGSAVNSFFSLRDPVSVSFENANLSGADFGNCNTTAIKFSGVTLNWSRFPNDPKLLGELVNGLNAGTLKLDGAFILCVEVPKAPSPPPFISKEQRKYIYRGIIFKIEGAKYIANMEPVQAAQVFSKLATLDGDALQDLGLDPGIVRNQKDSNVVRRELEIKWGVDFGMR